MEGNSEGRHPARDQEPRVPGCDHPGRGARTRAGCRPSLLPSIARSEEHTSELQSHVNLVCRLLLEKKKLNTTDLRNVSGGFQERLGYANAHLSRVAEVKGLTPEVALQYLYHMDRVERRRHRARIPPDPRSTKPRLTSASKRASSTKCPGHAIRPVTPPASVAGPRSGVSALRSLGPAG